MNEVLEDALLVVPGHELDVANCAEFVELAIAVIDRARPGVRLVVDLSGIEFMDSTGLGALISIRSHACDRGGSIVLRGACHLVRRIIWFTGLGATLPIE